MKNFYIYIYFDPRKPGQYSYGELSFEYEPFYVGKGKDKRLFAHLTQDKYNLHKLNKIKAIKRDLGINPIIKVIENNLTEPQAFDKEIFLIKEIGRNDLKLGPLLNATNGGDGVSNPSVEYRKKISDRMKGKNNPNYQSKGMTDLHVSYTNKYKIGQLNNFYGQKHTKETKKLISNVRKNESQLTKEKRTKSFNETRSKNIEKWCKKYEFISPEGIVYVVNNGLTKFVKEHGLSESVVNKICNNPLYLPTKGTAIGWKIRRF